MAHDSYKLVDTPAGIVIAKCPVCGAPGTMWRYSEDPNAPTETSVMCSNGERIGPQDGLHEGCLLYMPPPDFYRPTIREAVAHWNTFAEALVKQRALRGQP